MTHVIELPSLVIAALVVLAVCFVLLAAWAATSLSVLSATLTDAFTDSPTLEWSVEATADYVADWFVGSQEDLIAIADALRSAASGIHHSHDVLNRGGFIRGMASLTPLTKAARYLEASAYAAWVEHSDGDTPEDQEDAMASYGPFLVRFLGEVAHSLWPRRV